ncbi:hypothetical protein [Mangrovactinospora gilvigrisea]|uniref:hypothetical protein n=1 Tax=Mangrovactinospora gilvigrisea TaxID=1428644 RepID=UPI0015877A67|nr:hypothetical protein [Mangrovactinospora gilvigrisea]
MALLGDLEAEAQAELAAEWPSLRGVDVLKVAHHGSANQDAGLVARLAPRVALISVGVGNPYGHPTSRALTLLRGSRVLRTDTDGAVAVSGTSATLSVAVDPL